MGQLPFGGARRSVPIPSLVYYCTHGAHHDTGNLRSPRGEESVLMGAVMGSRLLSEGDACRSMPAASAIGIGVMALALG